MASNSNTPTPRASLPFLGLACAVGVSTIYYNQPLLLEMGQTYGATAGRVGFVAVATQVGYSLGLLLFVPLGDVLERRALMMRMYGAVAAGAAAGGDGADAGVADCGECADRAAGFGDAYRVADCAGPGPSGQRGRAIGIVMTGLLLGILLARTFAGWVSKIHGWR